jgi:diacylglycerol kinase family enzyme
VPVGSGNGLARTLRIPLEPRPALAALESGETRAMDVGFVNGRLFLNVAGAGFDAAVGADFHSHGKVGGRRGIFSYVRLSLARVWSYEPQRFELETEGERYAGRAFVVAFANGRQYGAGAVIARRARLDDGLLDVVVFERTSLARVALNGARLFLGGFDRAPGCRRFTTARATLRATEPFPYHRDGEPESEAAALTVEVRARALRIRVPHAAAADPAGPFLPSGSAPPQARPVV